MRKRKFTEKTGSSYKVLNELAETLHRHTPDTITQKNLHPFEKQIKITHILKANYPFIFIY